MDFSNPWVWVAGALGVFLAWRQGWLQALLAKLPAAPAAPVAPPAPLTAAAPAAPLYSAPGVQRLELVHKVDGMSVAAQAPAAPAKDELAQVLPVSVPLHITVTPVAPGKEQLP